MQVFFSNFPKIVDYAYLNGIWHGVTPILFCFCNTRQNPKNPYIFLAFSKKLYYNE